MLVPTKNNSSISITTLTPDAIEQLSEYLQQLSETTKKRFGPHPYDAYAINQLYNSSEKYIGYIARATKTNTIVAYAIIKIGYIDHDKNRLASYGLNIDHDKACTFAPSVHDNWQHQGIGQLMFQFILSNLKSMFIEKIILWGGVQVNNEAAVNYYLKNGFKVLGKFEYYGDNYDMIYEIQ
ncbi:MAG: GNAT family N-acetyltransferase [Ferruginibacter sp.]